VYLTYRLRRPRGADEDRGHTVRLARSTDGVAFEDIWSVTKKELGTLSMERSALHRAGDTWFLYLSYVDPADNRWRIDVVTAGDPSRFDVAARRPVLTAAASGTDGVKDPFLVRSGPAWLMFASYAVTATHDADRRAHVHDTGDAYNTGDVVAPTGLATSLDGLAFDWQGEVFGPGPGWDRYQARLGTILPVPGGLLGFYDGSADASENYEERCGLALSTSAVPAAASAPAGWTRLTPRGPRLTSPHATGALRYVDHVLLGSDLLLYYEYARADGSHELRVHRVPDAVL
jgi:hypothetical protein